MLGQPSASAIPPPLLVAVLQPLDPELVPVSEQAQELARVRTARDQHQLAHGRPATSARSRRRPSAGRDRQQVLVVMRVSGCSRVPAAGENHACQPSTWAGCYALRLRFARRVRRGIERSPEASYDRG